MGTRKGAGSQGITTSQDSCSKESMVSVETSQLKEKLNQVFKSMHNTKNAGANARIAHDESFDRLWDLKESAILEGRAKVELPKQWMTELDQACHQCEAGRKH